ncbi:MAG: hypothetical protein WD042_19170 [Phycisphaeraceae bacterium]
MATGYFNLIIAWVWFCTGLTSGAVQGLFFHDEHWLGGYASWRRRLTRLGHISFLGTGLLNAMWAVSLWMNQADDWTAQLASVLLIVGAVAMPAVCYLAAWKKPLRHLFFIPVASLIIGVVLATWVVYAHRLVSLDWRIS